MDRGAKVALLAIGVNLFLFGLKYLFAELSGSIALKAEAFHSLSDIVTSFTVLGGLIISRLKTKSFPYGLHKVENLVSVIVALVIFYVGYEIVMEVLKGGSRDLQHVGYTLLSVLCTIGVTYSFSRYEAKVGIEINSPSLVADAEHLRTDMFANTAVLVALLSSYTPYNLDKPAAFVIVVIIAWAGGKILLDGIRVLLDASLDYKTLRLAEEIIFTSPQVMEIKNLTGRSSGRYKFIEAVIRLRAGDWDKAHFIADHIETEIKKHIKNVDRVLIHYEPITPEELIYAVPVCKTNPQRICVHFSEAPYFALVTVRTADKNVVKNEVIANPYTEASEGRGIRVARLLNTHAVDVVLTRKSLERRGPYYVFASAAVESLLTEEVSLDKALERLEICGAI